MLVKETKIPHTVGQAHTPHLLSPCTITAEALSEPVLHNKRILCVPSQLERSFHSPQLEKACVQQQRPTQCSHQSINKRILKNFPGSLVVKTTLPLEGARVRSLVMELRSHMPQSTVKKRHKTDSKPRNMKETVFTLTMQHSCSALL